MKLCELQEGKSIEANSSSGHNSRLFEWRGKWCKTMNGPEWNDGREGLRYVTRMGNDYRLFLHIHSSVIISRLEEEIQWVRRYHRRLHTKLRSIWFSLLTFSKRETTKYRKHSTHNG